MNQTQLLDLLSAMTVDEKIGQMLQVTGDFYSEATEERTGPISYLGITEEDLSQVGTILGVRGAAESRRIQRSYLERSRLHVPTLFMGDVIHGCKTIFPIPLGIASSWSPQAVETMARISAVEASASGISVTFSPMVDLVRDPRWGRVMESTGEDSHLNGLLAAAMVRGYQGENLRDDTSSVAACVKHFAAYGAAIGGRDYNTVDMSERLLRELYLPGYQGAIDAGAKLVMTSFNTVGGIPATGNCHLLREILRDDFGFGGIVISDFGAVKELVAHGVAQDERQAACLAMNAGVDIEMMTVCYLHHLKKLISLGDVSQDLLNESVLRILQLKNELGLFERPYRGADEKLEKRVVFSAHNRMKSRKVAEESIVLLKNNESILPLSKSQRIAVVGPMAHSHDLLGAWSWSGRQEDTIALADALSSQSSGVVSGIEEFDVEEPSLRARKEAVELAKNADVVVLALGESSTMSGEAASRSDIRLPRAQRELFDAIRAVNDNLVVVLFNGRPLDLRSIDRAKAIVEAWYPGTEGGPALADILFGEVNPNAKLTMSFPFSVGQVPVYYNADNTGRPSLANGEEKYVSRYLDAPNDALYPFGFGLSYSHFTYGAVTVSSDFFSAASPLRVSVEIQNDSRVSGTEIVQLYVRDLVAEVERPVKELKGFKKIDIKAGDVVNVDFLLDEESVRYVHSDNRLRADVGYFDVMVGPNSRDVSAPVRVLLR